MIISKNGEILQAWFRTDGNLVHDSDNAYGIHFAIGVPYTDEQKDIFAKIKALKNYLSSTDYKAIKYSDGAITEEEYAPVRAERERARQKINELEFEEPTLTRAEMDEAERIAMENLNRERRANG